MKFKEYLEESKSTKFKAPKGFFEDESMSDDFSNEMEEEGLSWDVDYTVSDDGEYVTFNKVSSSVLARLKSWKFKKK